jgi:hypothetical protein
VCLVLPARAGVIVVASDGSGAFTDIQPALDAAQPGDVLLVGTGTYTAFHATRDVAIAADVGAGVHVAGCAIVGPLGNGAHVLLHRLRLFGAPGPSVGDGPGLHVPGARGSVRVQSCFLQGSAGWPGANVASPSLVGIVGSSVVGGFAANSSGSGLRLSGGAVALYGSEFFGADGAAGPDGPLPPTCLGGDAGHGLHAMSDAFVFAGGSLFDGGSGGPGGDGCLAYGSKGSSCHGGDGGNGIRLDAGTQTLWRLDSLTAFSPGGSGGHGQCGCGLVSNCNGDTGSNGIATYTTSGDVVVNLPGLSPALDLGTNPVREGGSLTIRVRAEPDSRVGLLVASQAAFAPQAGLGVRLVASSAPHLALRFGTTDPGGLAEDVWTIPELGPGVEARIVHVQAFVIRPHGSAAWSNAVELVMLDQAF